MGRLRDIKRQVRGSLHREMSAPALYIPVPDATPVPVTVRVWRKREDPVTGDLQSMHGAAQMAVSEDRLRFDLSEIAVLRRNAIVSVEAGEAYQVEFLYPADLGYQTARVVPLPEAETTGLPVPE